MKEKLENNMEIDYEMLYGKWLILEQYVGMEARKIRGTWIDSGNLDALHEVRRALFFGCYNLLEFKDRITLRQLVQL
jgi:hypothetical protein